MKVDLNPNFLLGLLHTPLMLSQYSMHTHVWQGWIEVLMASIEYCLLMLPLRPHFKDSSHILKAPGSMFCLDLVRYLSIKKSIEVNPPRSETAKRITFTNCSKCQTHFENPKFCLSAKENLCDDKWLRKESSSAPLTSSGHLFTTVSNFGMESFAILEFIRAKSTWKPNQILWKIIENELHLFLTFGHLEISRETKCLST